MDVEALKWAGSIAIVRSDSMKQVKFEGTATLLRGREMVGVVEPEVMTIEEVEVPAGARVQSMNMRTRWSEARPGVVREPEEGVAMAQASELTVNFDVVLPLA